MRFQKCGRQLIVETPAKLNLFLEVLGKRTDGYHELETLMVSIDRYDTLTFTEEESEAVHLQLSGVGAPGAEPTSVPDGSDNLILRAAELLRRHINTTRGARIRLTKRIPVAAGLAGGSSDAAATLVGLNRLWEARLTMTELMGLAAQLGSDVNFFIPSVPAAVCRGRGEQVEEISVRRPLYFVVARPRSGLSTADVFSQLKLTDSPRKITDIQQAIAAGSLQRLAGCLHNRLQPTARQMNTHIDELQQELTRLPTAGTLMSGSGSSCFALCHSHRAATCMAAAVRHRLRVTAFAAECRI